MWNDLTEEKKKPFNDTNSADKKRYDEEIEMIEKKGYFMLPDGRKSTDVRIP